MIISNVVRQLTKKDAYSAFEYALKAPETKRQWPRRLDVFLTFLQLEGQTIKERTNNLYDLIKTQGIDWLESHIIDFTKSRRRRAATERSIFIVLVWIKGTRDEKAMAYSP